MKPFDLEKAKNGDNVCRIDGTPAKILDFDYNEWIIYKYKDQFGRWRAVHVDELGKADEKIDNLYMAPRIAYMNVYKEDGPTLVGDTLHVTKEECGKRFGTADEERFFCIAKVELLED